MKQDYHCMVENWDEPSFGSIKTRGRNVTNPLNKERFFCCCFCLFVFLTGALIVNVTTQHATQLNTPPTPLSTAYKPLISTLWGRQTAIPRRGTGPAFQSDGTGKQIFFFLMYISSIWLWYASNFAQDWILYTKLARLMLCVITEDFGRPICCFQVFKILWHQQPHYHDKKKREHCCSVISFLFEPIPCFTTLHQYHTPRTFSGVTWQA